MSRRAGDTTQPVTGHPLWVPVLVATLGTITLTLLTYWTAIFQEYARSDDFVYVYDARTGNLESGLGLVWMDAGRPVPAAVFAWLLPPAESVADLAMIRLVSAVVLALGAAAAAVLAITLMGRRTPVAYALSLVVAGVAVSTTAAPSAVTWAVMAGQLPALPFAVIGGLIATRTRTRWRWAATALLIVLATFSYQHFAPIAFFVATISTATSWARRERVSWWNPVVVGSLVVASLAANYAFVMTRGESALSRISGPSPAERVDWFAGEFLPRTVDLTVPWSMGGASYSAVVAALLLLSPALLGVRYLAVPLAVVVSWLCTAVVIVPGELWASYRLISAAQFVLWVGAACCAAVCISGIWQSRRTVGLFCAGAAVVCGAFSMTVAHGRAVDYFAIPSAVDWESTKCAVAGAGSIAPGQVVEVNDWTETTSRVVSYDEYGMLSSAAAFALPFSVWLAMDVSDGEATPDLDPGRLVLLPPGQDADGSLRVSTDICGTRDIPAAR